MKKLLPMLPTALAVVVVSSWTQAAEPPSRGPHGPEMMFKRLDTNKDGKITADEVPEGAPDFIKGLLRRADKNEDKTITHEEFQAGIGLRPGPGFRPGAGPRPKADDGPQARPQGDGHHRGQDARRGRPGRGRGPMAGSSGRGDGRGRSGHGPGLMAGGPGRGGRFGMRGPAQGQRPLPDPKAIFQRLDRDKDGKLSSDEFAEGMKAFHQQRTPQRPPAFRPPMARGKTPWAGRTQGPPPWAGRMHGRAQGPPPWARAMRGRTMQGRAFQAPAARARMARAYAARAPFGRTHAARGRASHARPRMRRPMGPMAKQRPPMHPAAVAARMKAADKNQDGKLSKEEAPEFLKQRFARVDADKDGQLEPAELKKAGEAARKHMMATFTKRHPDAAKRIKEARKKAVAPLKPALKKPALKKKEAFSKKPVLKKPGLKKKEALAKKAELEKASAEKNLPKRAADKKGKKKE